MPSGKLKTNPNQLVFLFKQISDLQMIFTVDNETFFTFLQPTDHTAGHTVVLAPLLLAIGKFDTAYQAYSCNRQRYI